MALPPRERWNLGMRLIESLEVKDAGSGQAVDEPRAGHLVLLKQLYGAHREDVLTQLAECRRS